jgi:hypothetical protein
VAREYNALWEVNVQEMERATMLYFEYIFKFPAIRERDIQDIAEMVQIGPSRQKIHPRKVTVSTFRQHNRSNYILCFDNRFRVSASLFEASL